MPKRTNSSRRWLSEHFSDPYVLRAQQEGYRSRAVYKLIELDQTLKLVRPGLSVVELGAAPGGWTQYLADRLRLSGSARSKSRLIASDILEMDPLEGVDIVTGDFTEQAVLDRILSLLEGPADLVLSDMAPNLTGTDAIDLPRSLYLNELALELARDILKPGGQLLLKLFQGEGSDVFLQEIRRHFSKVRVRKPEASRSRSREVYVFAENLRRR
ncbi:MAG: RlmE family RNA methyltransferase [Thioalkalivibrionaceae bacterium]